MAKKILITKTVDAKTQKELRSDSKFEVGQAYLVKDEVADKLVTAGFGEEVVRVRPVEQALADKLAGAKKES